MVRSAGLWRAVVRRSRADWPVVLAAWLLLLCATTLLATGALYADTVAAGGIQRALLDAPPEDRAIVVRTSAARDGDLEAIDGPIRTAIGQSIARTGGEIAQVLRSGSFAAADVPRDQVEELVVLSSHEGIVDHAQLVTGTWPLPEGGAAVEAVLSEPAAEALGVTVGDRRAIVSRLDAEAAIEILVTGIFRPDPTDPYWGGDGLELDGVQASDPFTTIGPLVVPREDLLALGGRLDAQWRAIPTIEAVRADEVDAIRRELDLLDERFRDVFPPGRQIDVSAPLSGLLADVGRSVVVSRSGVTLLTIQFAVLAGYAILLVGGLLLERRRSETALIRSRGATTVHLLLMALAEGVLLAGTAVVAAPFLALALVGLLVDLGPLGAAGISPVPEVTPTAWLVATGAGIAGVLALALPTLTSTVSLSGVRAAIGRQTARTLPQRLGVDLALVAVAVVAIWQLRLYGAPLTRNARGVLGVDPLLVAAPAIGLLGGAVLALRIVPRVAEIGERLLERRRGLVAPLGGRQLARRPLRYTRAALLLMLAAGLATFATAHAATWTRSQGDQAAYQAAVDVRVIPADDTYPSLVAGSTYRAIDGVAGAMPVVRQSIDLGRNVRGGPLLALDASSAGGMLSLPATSAAATRALLDRLATARTEPPTVPLDGEPQRLSIVVDAAFSQLELEAPYDGTLAPDFRGVEPIAVVADADGRLHRLRGERGLLAGERQRLVVDLVDQSAGDGAAQPTWPLRLVAIEVSLTVPQAVAVSGTLDLVEVAASASSEGDGWTAVPVDPGARPWRWISAPQGAAPHAYVPPAGEPARLDVGASPDSVEQPIFAPNAAVYRLLPLPADPVALPILASRRFMEETAVQPGERLTGTSFGVPLPVEVVGVVDEFPPLEPDEPFVVLDGPSLELVRFAVTGQVVEPHEWWLDVDDGRSADVVAALSRGEVEPSAVVDRAALSRALSSDPVSLGIIGALGLGAIAAMAFAAIGFLVSSTVSTAERVGEFALLRALGLSGRQLAVWLSLESAFLLFVGLLAGCALGILLAWLVLPFATLTETGAPAVPAPVVVVPWQAIVPAWVLAVVLLVVTVVIIRRQLPAVRMSGVLRARDE